MGQAVSCTLRFHQILLGDVEFFQVKAELMEFCSVGLGRVFLGTKNMSIVGGF